VLAQDPQQMVLRMVMTRATVKVAGTNMWVGGSEVA